MNATTSPMFDGLNTCEPRYRITYFVSSEKPATPANTYQAWVLQWSSGGVLGTRRISATPLPVSIALAGQTKARLGRKVIATSRTAQVRIAARICGTLTWNPSATCPSTWIVTMTAATCRRESRMFGSITGYVLPPRVTLMALTWSRRRRQHGVARALRPGVDAIGDEHALTTLSAPPYVPGRRRSRAVVPHPQHSRHGPRWSGWPPAPPTGRMTGACCRRRVSDGGHDGRSRVRPRRRCPRAASGPRDRRVQSPGRRLRWNAVTPHAAPTCRCSAT